MNNRRLKKIIKNNTIQPETEKAGATRGFRVSRRVLIRFAQAAACLLLATAIGLGWMTMVRTIGRPDGDATGGVATEAQTPDPGYIFTEVTDEQGNSHSSLSTDNRGFEQYDFTGRAITFYAMPDGLYYEFSEGWRNGDVINDMLYGRNAEIMGSTGVDIKLEYIADKNAYLDSIRSKSLSSVSSATLSVADAGITSTLALEGLYVNMNALKELDFTADYWPGTMAADLSVGGKLYFASGSVSANTLTSIEMMAFNAEMLQTLGLESPYTLVDNGKWTLDKMLSMSGSVFNDLNANGTADAGDRFGLSLSRSAVNSLAYGAGIRLIDNSGSTLKLNTNAAASFCDKLAALTGSNDFIISAKAAFEIPVTGNLVIDPLSCFSGNVMFGTTSYNELISFSQNDTTGFHCGVVPMPVAYEGADYRTPVTADARYYAILGASDNDLSMAAAVLQFAAYIMGDNTYDILRYKTAYDDESDHMLKISTDSICFDLGRAWVAGANIESILPDAAVITDAKLRGEVFGSIDTYNAALSAISTSLK